MNELVEQRVIVAIPCLLSRHVLAVRVVLHTGISSAHSKCIWMSVLVGTICSGEQISP